MKLQQLRYLVEVEKKQLSISQAAESLCTSQSGISKQIRLLEAELGIELFDRKGKKLVALSVAGNKVLSLAKEVLNKVDAIKQTSDELANRQKTIAIATTHTQARYVLPSIVERFLALYPEINLNIHQGTPEQVANLLEQGEVDIAIATEVLASRESMVAMPCYQWSRSIIMPKDHPLVNQKVIDLESIVRYPVITYVKGFTGRSKQDEIFNNSQLQPNIVLTAVDADVIKTYVRLGLGVGIIADMAFNSEQDIDLFAHNVKHLFGTTTSYIAIKKERYIKTYVYSFIELCAPHLTRKTVERALDCKGLKCRRKMFSNTLVPLY